MLYPLTISIVYAYCLWCPIRVVVVHVLCRVTHIECSCPNNVGGIWPWNANLALIIHLLNRPFFGTPHFFPTPVPLRQNRVAMTTPKSDDAFANAAFFFSRQENVYGCSGAYHLPDGVKLFQLGCYMLRLLPCCSMGQS